MNKQKIQELFESFNNLTVLVIGDVMLDAYYWGKVERISPEAPVPIIHVQNKENRLGGAANVALNVQSLGAKAIICSVVGDGINGDVFRKTLKEAGFTTEGIIDSHDRMTTVKTRVISGGQHIVRIDEELTSPLNPTDERNLLECVKTIFAKHKPDVIIFEDYNKGVLTDKVIRQIIELSTERNVAVAVDPKKENFFTYEGCTLFKPNLKELKEGLKLEFENTNEEALLQAMKSLHDNMKSEIVLVTLSEHGVAVLEGDKYDRSPAHERKIMDVSGAGDTVISVAALALAKGLSGKEISQLSNLAGGLVCEKIGVIPIDKNQLLDEAISLMAE